MSNNNYYVPDEIHDESIYFVILHKREWVMNFCMFYKHISVNLFAKLFNVILGPFGKKAYIGKMQTWVM